MKKALFILFTFLMCSISFSAIGSEAKENIYLVQLLNQIDAMNKLVHAAEREQVKNSRVTFHYHTYRDSEGKIHNGLFEDIAEIKEGIEEKLNQASNEPHVFKPIKGDYLDDNKISIKISDITKDNLDRGNLHVG